MGPEKDTSDPQLIKYVITTLTDDTPVAAHHREAIYKNIVCIFPVEACMECNIVLACTWIRQGRYISPALPHQRLVSSRSTFFGMGKNTIKHFYLK